MKYFKIPLTENFSISGIATKRRDKSNIEDIDIYPHSVVVVFSIRESKLELTWNDISDNNHLESILKSFEEGLQFAIVIDDNARNIDTHVSPSNFMHTESVVRGVTMLVSTLKDIGASMPILTSEDQKELFPKSTSDSRVEIEQSIIWAMNGFSLKNQLNLMNTWH
jgi:hypothetical protein